MQSDPVDAWFNKVPLSQERSLLALRILIKGITPDVIEVLKWGRPCYSIKGKQFCYLHSTKHHATIGFEKGAMLHDTNGLLQGTGKAMRHIKIPNNESYDEISIQALLSEAARAM